MKIEIRKLDSEKVIAVTANRIAIQPPPDGSPFILTAEVDDGDSPIRIMLDNGVSKAVKRLALTRRDTYFVKAFHKGAARPHTVSSHHRKMPTTLERYRKYHHSPETRQKLAKAASKAWTPERTRRQRATIAAKQAAKQANNGGSNETNNEHV